ncbi:hypothetical protein JRQ81_010035 [Phrynocephalus forsythii]|uniref:Natriuretic peptides A n=1 Tax=Phrynocephalus forsythii TaxID=171643 RepID=A0A9Q1ARM6_9SAUR|nr:hypothetical protein JRQ81_010035 [Phrynocephalus forsythii]
MPRWSSLVLVFLHAGLSWGHPVAGSPTGPELHSLEDLLERLKEKLKDEDLEAPSYEADGNADDSTYLDLDNSESHPFARLDFQAPLPQAETEAQWRELLVLPKRRRHFSGCFGTRLERIGTQTGLGCKIYKPRRWTRETMDATRDFFASFALLLLLASQPSTTAHPVSLSPAKELASMEALLERLEEKIALMEDLQDNPDPEEPDTPRENAAGFLEDNDTQQMDTRAESVPYSSERSSALKHLRGLQVAKSMRESGCFGRRLDRIGSISGMGCRGSRRN